ncbi:MAG: phage major tail tube protein [Caulobacteraceae bacterium]|nr:phage major tail tube protein [Caulobacteraceae bacterium]
MASLPRKLKNMNLFGNGESFLGEIASVTLPDLKRKMEEWRGGGMNVAVDTDQGMEKMELEWGGGGWMPQVTAQFGDPKVAGQMLRFRGAVQRDDTGVVDAVEVVMRGRHSEVGRGESKTGEDTEQKMKTSLAFYAEYWNGVELVYVDALNMIERFGGVDRLAAQRAAIGA